MQNAPAAPPLAKPAVLYQAPNASRTTSAAATSTTPALGLVQARIAALEAGGGGSAGQAHAAGGGNKTTHGRAGPGSQIKKAKLSDSYAVRCRTASYKQTPAATETFKLSTVPSIGSLARKSQCLAVNCRMPSPSDPSTIAIAPVRST